MTVVPQFAATATAGEGERDEMQRWCGGCSAAGRVAGRGADLQDARRRTYTIPSAMNRENSGEGEGIPGAVSSSKGSCRQCRVRRACCGEHVLRRACAAEAGCLMCVRVPLWYTLVLAAVSWRQTLVRCRLRSMACGLRYVSDL